MVEKTASNNYQIASKLASGRKTVGIIKENS